MNNDGRADLFVAKGNVAQMPDFAAQDPNNLLLQREDGTFVEAGDRAGVASMRHRARRAQVVDLNLDGALDIVVENRWAPARGLAADRRGLGHWVALKLVQPGANRDAIGAWIEVRAGEMVTGTRSRRAAVMSAGGWCLHFGLADQSEAELRVIWPDGTEGAWQRVAADGVWVLRPGAEPAVWTR